MTTAVVCTSRDEFEKIVSSTSEAGAIKTLVIEHDITQDDLCRIAQAFGSTLTTLTISPTSCSTSKMDEIERKMIDHELDFSLVNFPELLVLRMQHLPLVGIHFTEKNTPQLQYLSIGHSEVEYFHTNLIYCKEMHFDRVLIENPEGFANSLTNSLLLEKFISYKFLGLGTACKKGTHKIMLPSCVILEFQSADDLDFLEVWVPVIQDFNLQECHSIQMVNILKRKPTTFHLAMPLEISKISTNFRVNMIEAANGQNLNKKWSAYDQFRSNERCRGRIFKSDENHVQYQMNCKLLQQWYAGKEFPFPDILP